MLFFSQHKILGAFVLTASFFNLTAGIAGLSTTVFTIIMVNLLGFNKDTAHTGLYSFNSLLLGIGFGSFFSFSISFWLWLFMACLLCIIICINLVSFLGKYGLPTLSIPFIIVFWLVLIATNGYSGMGLVQKESYVVFELYTGSANQFNKINQYVTSVAFPQYVALFLRSLSAVIFQNSLLAGLLMAIGILIHSRIAFFLLILGFIVACTVNHFTGIYPEGISNYHLGANFMMVSLAIGGFFLIPSIKSYLWAIVAVVVVFLLINALTKVLDVYNLPVFSMPFSLLTIALLYFFMLRTDTSGLQLTSIQNYAPEINLYQSLNGEKRYQDFKYISVYLPFMGTWTVSQDYHGAITHRGDWSEALDFVITDIDGKTFEYPGNKPEHYYCFNKPVLACADGFIEEIIQHIEDNEIGQVNLEQNWGNTIIIKHLDGLYSKVSHLKHRSAKFKPGDFVKQGDIIAMCGNSGRSPEPHLHFQFQSTPYIGSKTLAYPFAYYEKDCTLQTFTVPQTGEKIQQLEINSYLKHAFNFQPGYRMEVVSSEGKTEIWEVLTDLYNQPYFYCRETQCLAYFVKNANCFYFTRYYGTKDSLMYYFYLAAYKILFSLHEVQDTYAIDPETIDPRLWLQDVLAPFFIFTTNTFKSRTAQVGDQTSITTTSCKKIFAMEDNFMEASIHISKDGLERFETRFKNHNIITCEVKSI